MPNPRLNREYRYGFALGFPAEPDPTRTSGLRPVVRDESGERLFAEIRLYAFAMALWLGLVDKLVIVSGKDQADQIARMLTLDCGIDPSRFEIRRSQKSTRGNIGEVKKFIDESGFTLEAFVFITNEYHSGRVDDELDEAGIPIDKCPAELLWLLGRERTTEGLDRLQSALAQELGGGEYASRVALESVGRAKKLAGLFVHRETGAKIA